MKSMVSTAIVLSAGVGKRMGGTISKQYLELSGKPVIYYTLKAFEKSNINNIILVVGKDDDEYIKQEIIEKYNIKKITNIVHGGLERYNSVYNGLKKAEDSDIVLIHDGARPFIKPQEINNIIEETKLHHACVAAVKSKDTIKISDENGFVNYTPLRKSVWNVQTPQGFDYKIIKEAYENIISGEKANNNINCKEITDDAMVLERYNKEIKIKLIECSYENMKLTTPEDMELGKAIIKGLKSFEKT